MPMSENRLTTNRYYICFADIWISNDMTQYTEYFRKEVVKYCLISAPEFQFNANINIIGCADCAYNIETDEMLEFSPELFLQHKITAKFDKNAYDENVDKFLDSITLNDKELRNLIEEMVGYCLYRNTRYQKCFILSGGGSNGKSTLLDMISAFLGTNNTSALSLKNLQDKFKIAQIKDKLANINDDVSNERITDTELFKKLVVGGEFEAEQKNKNPFKMRSFAKIILSANEIPKSSDKSEGYFRRFIFLPLRAKFTSGTPNYDPNIIDKITTDNAKSYLLNLAIAGLKRLKANGRFTETEATKNEFIEYKEDNDPLFAFFNEYNIDSIIGKSTDFIYDEFNKWYKNEYQKSSDYKKTTVTRWLKTYNIGTEIRRVDGELKRVYISVTDLLHFDQKNEPQSVTPKQMFEEITPDNDDELPF